VENLTVNLRGTATSFVGREIVDLVPGFETGANDELVVSTNDELTACTPLPDNGNGVVSVYAADVVSAQDYAPFGMQMVGRTYNSGSYRYGFNGKENDNEVKGEGNQQDYGMRIYDPRVGRFLSVDPVTKNYPMLTPYQYASNRPIDGIDIDGLEFFKANDSYISMRVDYSPKLRKITGAETVYRSDNIPPKLREAIENQKTCTNCIGSDAARVAVLKIISNPPLYSTQEGGNAEDIDDPRYVGPDPGTMPIIPKNNKELRLQQKTKAFSIPIMNEQRVDQASAVLAIVQISGDLLERAGIAHLNSIIKQAGGQSGKAVDVANILQNGIDNLTISPKYQNTGALSSIANYLLYGADIMKYEVLDGKGKYVVDKDLMDLSKKLWKEYVKSKSKEDFKKQMENAQKQKVDNTGKRE